MDNPLQTKNPPVISSWANATFRDIETSLKGSYSVETGPFIGRGDYFIATSKDCDKKFIKTILKDKSDYDIQRRIEGEILASNITLPSSKLISPLVVEDVIESKAFSGDFYIVSKFQNNTENLESTKTSLPAKELSEIGHFVACLEQVQVPNHLKLRKATDVILSLSYLASENSHAQGSHLSNGALKALEIIRKEAPHIKKLTNEVLSTQIDKVFSHGDLKFSQFMEDNQTSKFFVCDWEECGVSNFGNDLCFLAADLFYSMIRETVDQKIAGIKDPSVIQAAYDDAVYLASIKIKSILSGYSLGKKRAFSKVEKRIINIRIGLAGLFRLYTVSAKSTEVRPRELALASIGMQIALGEMPEIFFEDHDEVID